MPLTKRVEVLLDPTEYSRLEEIARSRKESVGALVRRAVDREYLQPAREQKHSALQRLLAQQADFGGWGKVKEDIATEVVKELEAS